MTAIFIGLILAKLDMLNDGILILYIIYCVWRFIKLLAMG